MWTFQVRIILSKWEQRFGKSKSLKTPRTGQAHASSVSYLGGWYQKIAWDQEIRASQGNITEPCLKLTLRISDTQPTSFYTRLQHWVCCMVTAPTDTSCQLCKFFLSLLILLETILLTGTVRKNMGITLRSINGSKHMNIEPSQKLYLP